MLSKLVERLFGRVEVIKRHPREPWLWRADWASSELHHSSFGGVIFPIVLGIALLGLGGGLGFFFQESLSSSSPGMVAFILAMPLVGVIAILFGFLRFVRWQRFRDSTLVLLDNPGVVGGELRVELHSRVRPTPSDRVLATLKCMHRSKRELESSGENVTEIWKTEQDLALSEFQPIDGGRTSAVLRIAIPDDAEQTSPSNARLATAPPTGHYWVLEFNGKINGPNYYATFIVPVFKLDEEGLQRL